jgi:hypothetical protein
VKRWLPFAFAPLLLAGCLAVGPAGPYTNGQTVDVSILGFAPNATVWLSECGPGQVVSPSRGCTASLSTQQAVRLGSSGSGSAKFRVSSSVGGLNCAGYCTINATNGVHVQQVPISFLKQGSFALAAGFDNKSFSVNIGHTLATHLSNHNRLPVADVNPGTYKVDFLDEAAGIPPGGTPTISANVTVSSGKGTTAVIFPLAGNRVGLVQTEVPAPPAANRVRVTFVNESPETVTPKLGTIAGTPLAPGKRVTLTLTGAANVPNGDDSYTLTYPQRSGSMSCGTGDAGGFFFRGHGYVLTIVSPQPPTTGVPACPVPLEAVIQGGIV